MKNFKAEVKLMVAMDQTREFVLTTKAKDAAEAKGLFDGFFTAFGSGRVIAFKGTESNGKFNYDVQVLGMQT